ncbi:hypothetical protein DFS34DRAFT_598470 [Phlyctochytrium arcticum]|nr:hypothetical protein DFS34DRAFT_598470 [Phlyctochytrium arcticum]
MAANEGDLVPSWASHLAGSVRVGGDYHNTLSPRSDPQSSLLVPRQLSMGDDPNSQTRRSVAATVFAALVAVAIILTLFRRYLIARTRLKYHTQDADIEMPTNDRPDPAVFLFTSPSTTQQSQSNRHQVYRPSAEIRRDVANPAATAISTFDPAPDSLPPPPPAYSRDSFSASSPSNSPSPSPLAAADYTAPHEGPPPPPPAITTTDALSSSATPNTARPPSPPPSYDFSATRPSTGQ